MNDTTLPRSDDNLVWIDLEMTGLMPDTDRIIDATLLFIERRQLDDRSTECLGACPGQRGSHNIVPAGYGQAH